MKVKFIFVQFDGSLFFDRNSIILCAAARRQLGEPNLIMMNRARVL